MPGADLEISRRVKQAYLPHFTFAVLVLLFAFSPAASNAQSFFSTLVTDPTVGVDRSSVSRISKLDKTTAFFTFDTYGSDDIGPGVAGVGYAVPDFAQSGDQVDVIGILAGPASNGGQELLAAGIGYRFLVNDTDTQTYGFVQADYGKFDLGTPANAALDIEGEQLNISFGIQHITPLKNDAKLTTILELASRDATANLLGMPVVDEKLRILKLSALYEQGIPLLFQKRFALSITKGFDGFGASPDQNPTASLFGASSDFLRLAFSAEASIPLSQRLLTNVGIIGQWSDDNLPVSQKCGYNTNAYARGFDQSYVNGDRCLGARTELAYNFELPVQGTETLTLTQGYIGIDVGMTKDNLNAFVQSNSDTWSSASLGVRTLRGNFLGEITLSHILDQPDGVIFQDRTRLWVRAGIRF